MSDRKKDKEARKTARQEARSNRRRIREQKAAAFFSRNVPPGLNWEKELLWVRWGLICTVVLTSILFLLRCTEAVSYLYEYKWAATTGGAYELIGRGLKEGAMMPGISTLFDGTRTGFVLVGLLPVILAIWHYRYYRQGTMSIYVMKRLPDRREFHRRNLSLPLLMMGAVLAAMVLMELAHYGFYLLVTPKGCLPAGHWTGFWMWMIGGGL